MVNKLKNPIKEIVLSVSFEQNIDIAQLESISSNKQLLSDFSTCKPGFDAKVNLGEEPSSEFSHTGYIFKSDKEEYSSILNIKRGKISYHILNKYLSYDILLDILDRYWNILQKEVGNLNITNISARYINQINVSKSETFSDFVNVEIKSPFKNIKGKFINFKLEFPDKDLIKTNVIIANSSENNLILDIIVDKICNKELVKNISDIFIELRPIKNEIFDTIITEETKNKFEL
jgi:uncharacterized protein (TIGR04255 family)